VRLLRLLYPPMKTVPCLALSQRREILAHSTSTSLPRELMTGLQGLVKTHIKSILARNLFLQIRVLRVICFLSFYLRLVCVIDVVRVVGHHCQTHFAFPRHRERLSRTFCTPGDKYNFRLTNTTLVLHLCA
jgi:hypothetical protein